MFKGMGTGTGCCIGVERFDEALACVFAVESRRATFSCPCWLLDEVGEPTIFGCPDMIVLRKGLFIIWLAALDDEGGRTVGGGDVEVNDGALLDALVGDDDGGGKSGNGKCWWWAPNRLLSGLSIWEKRCIIWGDGAGVGSDLHPDVGIECLYVVGVFEGVGRTRTGTTGDGTDGTDGILVTFVGVGVGGFDRRCESKMLSVSPVDVVEPGATDVRHGVFITSRRVVGNGVDLTVEDETGTTGAAEGTEPLSMIGIVGSVTSAVAVAGEIPLATSSMTSSICDRDVFSVITLVD
jgi:hypothetical protein